MMSARSAFVHRTYQAVIAIKGLDGAIETLTGLLIALAGSARVYALAIWLTAPEIAHHPGSRTANAIRHSAASLSHASHTFVVTYLLVHGILKLAIAVNLIRERNNWIFPVATVILGGFIAYMGYRLAVHWSTWLLAFALFDLFTVALVLNEWKNHKWAVR